MSLRFVYVCLFILTAGWFAPGELKAQDAPAQQASDSLALTFEREVFTYPEYERRNPFTTLVSADGGGPRFENLLLLGILYSPFAGESLALFGEGTRTVTPGTADAPETVSVDLTGGTYRVREGATLGNLTVTQIDRLQVTIELVEFGLTESRTLLLPRGVPGGGP
jgi:hypothetical protein